MSARRGTVVVWGLAMVALAAAVVVGVWAGSASEDLEREQAVEESQEHAVGVLAQRDSQRFELEGRPGALVVARTGEAVLIVSDLPRAPAGLEYRAWILTRGTLEPDVALSGGREQTVFALRGPVPQGSVVSITLEPAGGITRQTGEPLFSARAR